MDYINGSPIRRKNPELVTRDSGARRAGSYDLSRNPEFQQWFTVWAKAMLRITKPGGFLLCFGGTRTYHRLACAIEDAGWEIRDCMCWLYGSGFPKSLSISKAIDKTKGTYKKGKLSPNCRQSGASPSGCYGEGVQTKTIDEPQSELAQLWDGYGTGLKPAWEPIIVAMKPLDGTFAHNAEKWSVAGLNIDGGRIETIEKMKGCPPRSGTGNVGNWKDWKGPEYTPSTQGRWPANLLLDEKSAAMLDEQTGISKPKKGKKGKRGGCGFGFFDNEKSRNAEGVWPEDAGGGASRFFYVAKTSKKERNMGMDDCEGKKVNDGRQTPIDNPYQRGETVRLNIHPTVKPLALMRYLCTLLKMPGSDQIILDPFLGSGTTGIACKELGINFIGIEKEQEYCEIAVKRIAAVKGQEITLHSGSPEKSLPVTKNVETAKNSPHVSESRQRIIDEAVRKLKSS